jgi:serine/threonine protein kinase
VLSLLGKGGMGEVCRVRDTKLKRDVAIKVLPEAFALDPERMARFQREGEVLASLNHPNIATVHGVEESNGFRALVMELVPGGTSQGASSARNRTHLRKANRRRTRSSTRKRYHAS